ncbi:hypothetical protein I5520_01700 [Citrobacter sp. FDAARGOS_156]|uniref:hypothetical protein n=1 Tax=Citrobacter sp. FDAARGOS_156 TaxID=1702170 RepID=UPI001908E406|nr:hypothetical protein [Citrobacter sp. FDAARGOS_156]MBJ9640711.1 hypothetical protein [Citrobacter sp. FDAARGOS_156]
MASVYVEVKKNGHYSTNSEEENEEALDLQSQGIISISHGGSHTVNGDTITILNCSLIKKSNKKRA